MGPNLKLRRPFIWQDEMMEVRELFKRVERVRRSGFTGFSTWESPPPSADTLSRNRLRRRRALCSVELSHLNYKEAPFESLNHLQNIRGMCTRIQRQDYPMERKKKDVDLVDRPPLIRRPVTTINVEKRGRKRPPFEVGRPYSAPVATIQSTNTNTCPARDLGPTPLQYATPKLTTLYDITQKSHSASRSYDITRKSFNVFPPVFDQCPNASSKLRQSNNGPIPRPLEECESAKAFKMESDTYGQVKVSNSLSSSNQNMSHLHHTSTLKPSSKHIEPDLAFNISDMNNSPGAPNLKLDYLSRSERNYAQERCIQGAGENGEELFPCAWSTSDDVTTSSSADYSTPSLSKCGSSLRSPISHLIGPGQNEKEKPSFIRPISDYPTCFASKHHDSSRRTSTSTSPSKLPLAHPVYPTQLSTTPTTPDHVDIHVTDGRKSPCHVMRGGRTPSTENIHVNNTRDTGVRGDSNPHQLERIFQPIEELVGGGGEAHMSSWGWSEAGGGMGRQAASTSTTESRWLTSTPRKACTPHSAMKLHLELERIGRARECQDIRGGHEEEKEQEEEEEAAAAVEDPNVLIKHSSDPYSDFRLSMVTMIEEEGLQDHEAELEELFQYYLDLNPKVHHQVLHKVIGDIRTDYLLKSSV